MENRIVGGILKLFLGLGLAIGLGLLAIKGAHSFSVNYASAETIQTSNVTVTDNAPSEEQTNLLDQESLIASINKARRNADLPALKINAKLNLAATRKATNMQTKKYFSHTDPDGKRPWTWILEAGYKYQKAAENLAKDYTSSESVVEGWLQSESHRSNILNSNYKDLGIGIVMENINGQKYSWIVTMFGEQYKSGLFTKK